MNKAFEKILERLEVLIEKSYYEATEGSHNAGIRNSAYHKVKKIVQKVAEEFATDTNVGTNGWIPCSERLPEKKGFYLVTGNNGLVYKWFFIIDCDEKYWLSQNPNLKPIAWMPLPEPYKESEE